MNRSILSKACLGRTLCQGLADDQDTMSNVADYLTGRKKEPGWEWKPNIESGKPERRSNALSRLGLLFRHPE